MRISDWSSDVCSSDLGGRHRDEDLPRLLGDLHALEAVGKDLGDEAGREVAGAEARVGHHRRQEGDVVVDATDAVGVERRLHGVDRLQPRSEEHTSELQSLMRISYAVFCLKKKKTNRTQRDTAKS